MSSSSFLKRGGLLIPPCPLIPPCFTQSLSCLLRAVRNSSTDLATSSRSASFFSRRYVDKSARLKSRNCCFINKSLRASYVCGASASFTPRSKYVLRRTMNMLGFSPSSGEQERNRCLQPSSVRLYLFYRTSWHDHNNYLWPRSLKVDKTPLNLFLSAVLILMCTSFPWTIHLW